MNKGSRLTGCLCKLSIGALSTISTIRLGFNWIEYELIFPERGVRGRHKLQ